MKREHDLERRLRSLDTLGEAVSAVKSISAHHLRRARAQTEPARVYRAGIDDIIARTGARLPAGPGPAGLLVIGGQLGLCGGYNARLVALATSHRAARGPGPTLCMGRRAAALLRRHGVAVDREYPTPTSIGGVTDRLLSVAQDLLGAYADRGLGGFDVVSSRFAGVGADQPVVTRLLPIDRRPTRPSRAPYGSPDQLEAVAVRELLYVTLYSLLIDALASEHGARLLATQSAETWLDRERDRLHRQLAAARREAGTQEVVEIAAGARAARARGAPGAAQIEDR